MLSGELFTDLNRCEVVRCLRVEQQEQWLGQGLVNGLIGHDNNKE